MKEQRILLVDADGDSEGIVSEAAALTGRDVLVAKTSRAAFKILGDQMHLVIVDAVYQLGPFATAAKKLKEWDLKP
jgi:DNA-binding response OmpR family regulator